MEENNVIKKKESSIFRALRVIWPILLIILTLAIVYDLFLIQWILLAIYAAVSILLFTWRCPRCGGIFSIRFGVISIVWPYNGCLHCGSVLEK